MLDLHDATGAPREVAVQVEVRSCRQHDGEFVVGATIDDIDAEARLALMEWCYVVCNHEQLRGHRPDRPAPVHAFEPIVVTLDGAEPEPAVAGEAAVA
jgi:hypothetical protein